MGLFLCKCRLQNLTPLRSKRGRDLLDSANLHHPHIGGFITLIRSLLFSSSLTKNETTKKSNTCVSFMVVSQTVKKSSAYYKSHRFITTFSTNYHLTLPWASCIKYTHFNILLFKTHFNIIFPSRPGSLTFIVSNKNNVCISHHTHTHTHTHTHACYMPHPSHPP